MSKKLKKPKLTRPHNSKKQVAEMRKEMETRVFKLLTYKQLEAVLTPKAFETLCEWMNGQTCALDENGDCLIYPWDLERWISQGCRKAQNVEDWD